MSKGINKVLLIGHLGADPETRATQTGTMITNLRLATTESWKDQSGNRQDRTEWHRVVLFGRTAEVARDYLRKGAKVYIEGSLRTSSYEKNGEKRYSTDIVASDLQMLDRRDTDAPSAPARAPSGPPMTTAPNGMPNVPYDDSDIPF